MSQLLTEFLKTYDIRLINSMPDNSKWFLKYLIQTVSVEKTRYRDIINKNTISIFLLYNYFFKSNNELSLVKFNIVGLNISVEIKHNYKVCNIVCSEILNDILNVPECINLYNDIIAEICRFNYYKIFINYQLYDGDPNRYKKIIKFMKLIFLQRTNGHIKYSILFKPDITENGLSPDNMEEYFNDTYSLITLQNTSSKISVKLNRT